MLDREPIEVAKGSTAPALLKNWQSLKRPTIAEFEKYWYEFTSRPMFDFSVAEAKIWTPKLSTAKHYGMRNKFTGKPHGICRQVTTGYIAEGTYLDGRPLGLVRIIGEKSIEMFWNSEKGPAGWIEFNPDFKQTAKVTRPLAKGLLDDITAKDF